MINNHKGAALPMVIMIMLVLTILGTTILTISLAEARQVNHMDHSMQAYYIARSGADALASHIIKNPGEVSSIAANTSTNEPASGDYGGGTFEMNISDVNNNTNLIRIDSVGTYLDRNRRVSVTLVRKTPSEIFKRAIFTNSDLDITNMKVTGEVESVGTIQYSTNGSNAFYGDAFPHSKEFYPNAVFPSLPLSSTPIIIAKKDPISLPSNFRYTSVSAEQNGSLSISANGTVSKLIFDKLVIDSSLDISTSSGGRVEIYITGQMVITTKGVINNDQPSKLIIYLAPGARLEMQSGKIFNGYIYGPTATVQIQSNHSQTNGAIISNIVVKNNTGAGPNGVMNYVPIGSNIPQLDAVRAYRIQQWKD